MLWQARGILHMLDLVSEYDAEACYGEGEHEASYTSSIMLRPYIKHV